ncbi:nucleotidyltransferase [Lentzea sp. NPDC004782]|uniref:nucleotidyltransferase domain-containing protein n=1 Tax=Lentzea sp. NPDC004782 TaxID=3154458 RepID=UPI0033B108E4
MTDSPEELISQLLTGGVEQLDIPDELLDKTITCYEDVGESLLDQGGDLWSVHPQGSITLGTMIRPPNEDGEYDIDIVCHKAISKTSTTQEKLKNEVGDMLAVYETLKTDDDSDDLPILSINECRRCWTLSYDGFHLDVVPCVVDEDYPPDSILLTDLKLRPWHHSNPKGYAEWFRDQSAEMIRALEAKAEEAGVPAVPNWTVRTTLQRMVQVLKWHCANHFIDDLDDRPPSVIITTLAAHAYSGETDVFTAALNAVTRMPDHIIEVGDKLWVPNPAHELENFADKWNEPNKRHEKFRSWLDVLAADLNSAGDTAGRGLDHLVDRLGESFDLGLLRKSAQRMGLEAKQFRDAGKLGMSRKAGALIATSASAPPIRKHTFHGPTQR